MRTVLAAVTKGDWELPHVDVEQTYLQASINEEIYVELPEDYPAFPNAVRLLRKATYRVVQSGLCCVQKFYQSYVDPCVFRRLIDGKAVTAGEQDKRR